MYKFFYKYFVDPITYSTGYNIVNTLVYALILVLAILLIYRVLKKLNIKIDGRFALALLPWILFGSTLRVLEDAGYFNSYFLISPLIYLTLFAFTFSSLLISLGLERQTKVNYHSYFFTFGFILFGVFFTQITITNFLGVFQILSLDLIALVIILNLGNLKNFTRSVFNKLTIFSQVFDANATFVSLQLYAFREQHVVPNLLVSSLGGNWAIFIFIKLAMVVAFLYFVEKYLENENFKNWIKLIAIILGLAQGTRDLLALGIFG